MAENEHELHALRDKWFLKQNRMDSVLMEEFRAGSKVVICKSCKKVWMAEIWDYKDGCPARECDCKETIPFTKDALKLGPGRRIHIKQAVWYKGNHLQKIKMLWSKYLSGIIKVLKPVSAWCLALACMAAVIVTVVQYRQGELPDFSYFKYRFLYLSAFMKMKCQIVFEMTVSKSTASLINAWTRIVPSITDTWNISFPLLKKTAAAAWDAVLKTFYHFYRH